MSTQTESRRDSTSRFSLIVQRFYIWFFAAGVSLLLTGILSLNLFARSQVDVAENEPATEEILAPRSITYVSEVLTNRARELAASGVDDIYTAPDLDIGRNQSSLARATFSFVETVRADSAANLETRLRYIRSIAGLTIEEPVALNLISLSSTDYEAAKRDVLRIIQEVMREQIIDGQENRARQSARRRVSFDLTPAQETVVTSLAPQFVVANTFFDESATEQARIELADSIAPVEVSFTEGQPVLVVGDIIGPEDMEALEKLGLLQRETSLRDVGSHFIFALLAVVLISLYWQQFHVGQRDSARYLLILALLLIFFALAGEFLLPVPGNWGLLYPAAALAMLVAVIFDVRLAVLITFVMAAAAGVIANNALEMSVYAAGGALMAILTLRDVQRINAFFRAGLVAAVGNMAVILVFRLPGDPQPLELLQLLILSLGNGLISASLTLAGFFVIGGAFGVITTLQLQELSRLDHPLLKELLRRAPGTYHHSIMVANLAEQAAERVEANGSLVRVGAFYHDVGKTTRPPFFSENQDGVNPHDTLAPESSARIIISHVSDGLELAARHRLPDRVRDFIAEHHGTRITWAFYRKAVELVGEENTDQVDMERYRYPGPRPRSRETAIVMLADAIESTSTALRPNTEAAIERLVHKIVADHLQEGQLDESGLTLGDIHALRASFIETLKGRFHVRVRYPGNEVLEEELAGPPVLTPEPAATAAPPGENRDVTPASSAGALPGTARRISEEAA